MAAKKADSFTRMLARGDARRERERMRLERQVIADVREGARLLSRASDRCHAYYEENVRNLLPYDAEYNLAKAADQARYTLKQVSPEPAPIVIDALPQIPTVRIWNGEIDTRPISFARAIWEELHPGESVFDEEVQRS